VDPIDRVEDDEYRLAKALAENSKLLAENQRLRKLLDIKSRIPGIALGSEIGRPSVLDTKSTSDEKIRLFRTLFRGREDVYAIRWEGKGDKAGYSPAYVKDGRTWFKSMAEAKQKRNFLPLTDHVIRDHLLGKQTMGIYPLLQDETCWFLAVDFDKSTWAQDAITFLGTCSMWDIPAYLERSRSGNGAHVWIFLDEPLKASLVRKMGAAVLTRSMEQRHQLGLVELRPEQKQAAEMLLAHDIGILSATTAFGKTVVAAWMIAVRNVNTLILVHRRQLLDQWRECLALFFDLPKKQIGQIGGGSRKPSGRIDVAVIQSLNRKHIVDDIVEKYGHIVVDECHHLSAFSFEQVLRRAKARCVLGLTATPIRKDGHHPIIIMQCGPIRYRVNPRIQARNRPFGHSVVPRFTGFCLPLQTREPEINEIYSALDTLFLAMPISWRGTLHQYVGRLHRLHGQKKEVVVYDYVDAHIPMLLKMFDRRRRGYEAVGYAIGESRLVEVVGVSD